MLLGINCFHIFINYHDQTGDLGGVSVPTLVVGSRGFFKTGSNNVQIVRARLYRSKGPL